MTTESQTTGATITAYGAGAGNGGSAIGKCEVKLMPDKPNTTGPDWMLVVSGKGVPLYWIAASGERRDAADEPPPRDQWHPEMKEAYPND